MIKKLLKKSLVIGLACLGSLASQAALPTFRTFSAAGNATTPAFVYMPADPSSQIRVVSVFYQGDTNNAALTFSAGIGAYYQANTNASTSSITNWVNSTNGLVNGNVLVLQQGGVGYTNTLVSYGTFITGTNSAGTVTNQAFVVLGSGGWGVAATVYSDIYQMGTATTFTVGNNTNSINGDAIYVGNYGRPLILSLTPALATNRIITASTHYDSATQ